MLPIPILGGLGLLALVLWRRRGVASGYATGQAGTHFGPAIEALNAMTALWQQADTLTKVQNAGQFGVTQVAPAIDNAGQPNATQYFTHLAWLRNNDVHGGGIAKVVGTEKEFAWDAVHGMIQYYWQAIAAGQAAERAQHPPIATPAPASVAPPLVAVGPAHPGAPHELQATANTLLAAIRSTVAAGAPVFWSRAHGQGQGMWRPTYDFQLAYNNARWGQLGLDGVYGNLTDTALKNVAGAPAVLQAQGIQGHGSSVLPKPAAEV